MLAAVRFAVRSPLASAQFTPFRFLPGSLLYERRDELAPLAPPEPLLRRIIAGAYRQFYLTGGRWRIALAQHESSQRRLARAAALRQSVSRTLGVIRADDAAADGRRANLRPRHLLIVRAPPPPQELRRGRLVARSPGIAGNADHEAAGVEPAFSPPRDWQEQVPLLACKQ